MQVFRSSPGNTFVFLVFGSVLIALGTERIRDDLDSNFKLFFHICLLLVGTYFITKGLRLATSSVMLTTLNFRYKRNKIPYSSIKRITKTNKLNSFGFVSHRIFGTHIAYEIHLAEKVIEISRKIHPNANAIISEISKRAEVEVEEVNE